MNVNRMIFLTAVAELFAMLNWFNYSAVLPILRENWHMTASAAGYILAAFQIGYVLSTLALGALADRISSRRIFIFGATLAAVGGLGFSLLAAGPGTALLCRVIAGIGLGGVYVPGLRYLTDCTPPSRRSSAFGLYVGALVLGSGASLLVAAPLARFLGWRWIMAVTSAAGLVGAALMAATPEPPRRPAPAPTVAGAAGAAGASPASGFAPLWQVMRTPGVLRMTLAYTGHMWELYAFWGWVAPFLARSGAALGLGPEAALRTADVWSGVIIVAGAPATVLAGLMADRLGRGKALRLFLIVSGICSAAFGWLSGRPLLALGVVGLVYGFAVVGDSPLYSAGVSESAPPGLVGLSLAFQQVVGFSITIVSQAMVGLILQATGDTTASWGWAFLALAPGPLAALWALRQRRPARTPAPQ